MPDRHTEVRVATEADIPAFNAVPHYVFASSPEDVNTYAAMPAPIPAECRLGVFVDGKVTTTYVVDPLAGAAERPAHLDP